MTSAPSPRQLCALFSVCCCVWLCSVLYFRHQTVACPTPCVHPFSGRMWQANNPSCSCQHAICLRGPVITVLHCATRLLQQLQTLVSPLGTPTKPKTRSSPGAAGFPQAGKHGTRSAARTAPEVRWASVDLASMHWIANIPSACHVCACKQTGRLLCVQHGGASWPGRTTNRSAGAHSCHQHPAYYMQHVSMSSVYCTACTSPPFQALGSPNSAGAAGTPGGSARPPNSRRTAARGGGGGSSLVRWVGRCWQAYWAACCM